MNRTSKQKMLETFDETFRVLIDDEHEFLHALTAATGWTSLEEFRSFLVKVYRSGTVGMRKEVMSFPAFVALNIKKTLERIRDYNVAVAQGTVIVSRVVREMGAEALLTDGNILDLRPHWDTQEEVAEVLVHHDLTYGPWDATGFENRLTIIIERHLHQK